jgi:hypothetical protein
VSGLVDGCLRMAVWLGGWGGEAVEREVGYKEKKGQRMIGMNDACMQNHSLSVSGNTWRHYVKRRGEATGCLAALRHRFATG